MLCVFLRINHMSVCRVYFNVAEFVQHRKFVGKMMLVIGKFPLFDPTRKIIIAVEDVFSFHRFAHLSLYDLITKVQGFF